MVDPIDRLPIRRRAIVVGCHCGNDLLIEPAEAEATCGFCGQAYSIHDKHGTLRLITTLDTRQQHIRVTAKVLP